jgi:hypothetical protein
MPFRKMVQDSNRNIIAFCNLFRLTEILHYAILIPTSTRGPDMPSSDEPGVLLAALDASILDFRQDYALRFETGAMLADRDIGLLRVLAKRLAGDLVAWAGVMRSMDIAIQEPFAPYRASRLIIECVMEEALTPTASSLLGVALDMVLPRS